MAITTNILLLSVLVAVAATDDPFSFVFKGCSNQSLPGGGASIAAVSSSLLSLSASSRFSKASTTGSQPLISALFQCRGDLPLSTCSACVRRIPPLWFDLCPLSAAARIQLAGCYALYSVSGSPQLAGMAMLYKRCSSAIERSSGFEERRDEAFATLESSAAAMGEGFYSVREGGVEAAAQCEGELSVGDCGECVAEAVQRAEVECGGAAGGEMYLDKCYVVYGGGGVSADGGGFSTPAAAVASGGGGYNGGGGPGVYYNGGGGASAETGEPTQKTVAIVVGGAAGLGFIVIFILFFRSVYKKEEY